LRERLANPSQPLDGATVLAAFRSLSAAFAWSANLRWLAGPDSRKKLRKCRRVLAPAAPCASRTLRGPAL